MSDFSVLVDSKNDSNNCSRNGIVGSLERLNNIAENISSSIGEIFLLVRNNESFEIINKNNEIIKKQVQNILLNSKINEKQNENTRLIEAKYLRTVNLVLNKLAEITKLTESNYSKDSNLKLNFQNLLNEFKNQSKSDSELFQNSVACFAESTTYLKTIDHVQLKPNKAQLSNNNSTYLDETQSKPLNQFQTQTSLTSTYISVNSIKSNDYQFQKNLSTSSQRSSFHNSVVSFIENIKKLDVHFKSFKSNCDELNNEIKEQLNTFFDELEKLLNEEKEKFVFETCQISFYYIIIAKALLESLATNRKQGLENQDYKQFKKDLSFNNTNEMHASINHSYIYKTDKIEFSCKPISIEPVNNEFNKNIISIKLKEFLNTPANKKLNETQIESCYNCKTIYSCLSTNVNSYQWRCSICKNLNIHKLNNNHIIGCDIEYTKNIKIKTPESNIQEKIIVFCIDVSGSMAGNKIEIVKNSCLKTIELIKQKNPLYKVALITFESSGKYYGDGREQESTVCLNNNNNIFQSMNYRDVIRSSANKLLPIQDSFQSLNNLINRQKGDGNTSICPALAHSVFLASAISNSEIILCTDGCAQDKSEKFYDSVTRYCNENGNIRINIITFEDTDCDLYSLGKLAANTNGIISKTSDPIEFKSSFKQIIEKTSENTLRGSVNIIIHGDSNCIQFENNDFKIKKQNLDKNTDEILIEFTLKSNLSSSTPDSAYFQFQFDSEESIRVYSCEVDINKNNLEFLQNNKLIHTYSLRKLSNIIYDEKNLNKAKDFLKEYSRFNVNVNEDNIPLVKETVEIVTNLNDLTKQNESQTKVILNNKNICSNDIKLSNVVKQNVQEKLRYNEIKKITELNDSQLENFTNFTGDEKNKYDEFDKKVNCIFNNFDLEKLFFKSDPMNIKKIMASFELIKQAFYLMQIIKCTIGQDSEIFKKDKIILSKDDFVDEQVTYLKNENQNKYLSNKTDDLGELIDKIVNVFSEFKSHYNDLNKYNSTLNRERDDLFLNLLEDLINFLNKNEKLRQKNSTDYVASNLYQRAKKITTLVEIIHEISNINLVQSSASNLATISVDPS